MNDRLVSVDELVTVDDIAQRLMMNVNVVCDLVARRDRRHRIKFPKPLVGRGTRAVWLWPEVETWYMQVAPGAMEARRRSRAAKTYKQPSWSHGRRTA